MVLAVNRPGDTQDEPVAVLGGQCHADAAEDVSVDLVADVQEMEPDGGPMLSCEIGSYCVGSVAQTLCGIEDRLFGFLADARRTAEGKRHEGSGDADFLGDVALSGRTMAVVDNHALILPWRKVTNPDIC